MAFSRDFPAFTLRRDAFPEDEAGTKMFEELSQLVDSIKEFQVEMSLFMVDRIRLTKYTNAAAANAQIVEAKAHFAYNTTDEEPMFYNGTAWKKVSDGTNAT